MAHAVHLGQERAGPCHWCHRPVGFRQQGNRRCSQHTIVQRRRDHPAVPDAGSGSQRHDPDGPGLRHLLGRPGAGGTVPRATALRFDLAGAARVAVLRRRAGTLAEGLSEARRRHVPDRPDLGAIGRLVQQGNQLRRRLQGFEDACRRPGRQSDAGAGWNAGGNAAGRGAAGHAVGRDRCDRVRRAVQRHVVRSVQGGEVLLLAGLARALGSVRLLHQSQGVGVAVGHREGNHPRRLRLRGFDGAVGDRPQERRGVRPARRPAQGEHQEIQ